MKKHEFLLLENLNIAHVTNTQKQIEILECENKIQKDEVAKQKDEVDKQKTQLGEKDDEIEELKEQVLIKTRQYAKRQFTWQRGQMKDWKGFEDINYLDLRKKVLSYLSKTWPSSKLS